MASRASSPSELEDTVLIQCPNSLANSLTPDTPFTAYRFTLPHSQVDHVNSFFADCHAVVALEHSEKHKEHFHVVCLTPTHPVYKSIANRIARCKWARAQYWSKRNYKNDFVGALRYTIKDGNYHLLGTLITQAYLSTISPWTKCAPTVETEKREKLSDPVLTLSNVIKQAVKFRAQHYLTTNDLGEVVHLMLTHGWIPSRDLLKGLPSGHFDLFRIRVVPGSILERPIWCKPHDDPRPWTPATFYAPGPPGGGSNKYTYHDYQKSRAPSSI